MSFVELKNPKTEKYLDLVEEIKSENFPWFYVEDVIRLPHNISKIPWYSHAVLTRCSNINEKSFINSNYYQKFEDVLYEIFDFNSIKIKRFYRINVNSTHNFSNLIAPVHVDHSFEHNQLIVYLNDVESHCPTYLFNEKYNREKYECCYVASNFEETLKKFTLEQVIQPKKDKIISFDGLTFHSYKFPQSISERRICIVVTYCPL